MFDTDELLYYAWSIICSSRPWDDTHEEEWEAAKVRFREQYFKYLGVDTSHEDVVD